MSPTNYRPIALRMYRVLLRQSRTLRENASSGSFLLQPLLDPRNTGSSHIFTSNLASPEHAREYLYRFFAVYMYSQNENELLLHDWLEDLLGGWYHTLGMPPSRSLWADTSSLRDAIKFAFREAPPTHDDEKPDDFHYTQWSIGLFKLLQEQCALQKLTSVSTDRSIRVVATSQCVGRSINHPQETIDDVSVPKYRFAYRIRVENNSSDIVQLLGRSWHIQETVGGVAVGEPIRVHAPTTGAVGKLPVLHPGQAFEYSSGCELVTPTGEMKGCFYFCGKVHPSSQSAVVGVHIDAFDRPEDCFEVTVTPFPLVADDAAIKN